MNRTRQFSVLAVLTLMGLMPAEAGAQQCGGTERWPVKVGTDTEVGNVDMQNKIPISVQDIIHLTEPHRPPNGDNNTRLPQETHVYVVQGHLVKFKLETGATGDQDYHIVISDDSLSYTDDTAGLLPGHSLVAEIPDPNCIAGKKGSLSIKSRFANEIRAARNALEKQFPNIDSSGAFNDAGGIPVQIVAVGFFDFPHHQVGRASNNIEMHPVLEIIFNPESITSISRVVPPNSGTDRTLSSRRVEAVATDGMSLDVATAEDGKSAPDHLLVRDTSLQSRLKQLKKGDNVNLAFSVDTDGSKILKVVSLDVVSPSPDIVTRLGVLLGSAFICFLLYYLLSGLHPLRLIVGEDGRYSNSKFQIALWFAVLVMTYIATIWLRVWYAGSSFLGGVNIPQNLLLISGMSAFTFGAAKGITTSKVEDAKSKGVVDPKHSTNIQPNFLLDLTHSDGKTAANGATQPLLDFGDFQMIVVTLLAVAVYIGLVFVFLGAIEKATTVSLPDVDTTILATFALGQGAYLTKKALGKVGES